MRSGDGGGSGVIDSLLEVQDSLKAYEEIIAVYLFGSHAQRKDNNLSDVDLGLLLREDVSAVRQHELRLELISFFSQVLSERRVDVVVLNNAPYSLAYRAISDGQLIYERRSDLRDRIAFESNTYLRYFDFQPVERLIGEAVLKRIKEGKFGV